MAANEEGCVEMRRGKGPKKLLPETSYIIQGSPEKQKQEDKWVGGRMDGWMDCCAHEQVADRWMVDG